MDILDWATRADEKPADREQLGAYMQDVVVQKYSRNWIPVSASVGPRSIPPGTKVVYDPSNPVFQPRMLPEGDTPFLRL